jgi:hypothetical protein
MVNIRPRARTYGPECDKGLYFNQPSSLYIKGLIEGFSHNWETRIIWNTRRHYTMQVSFNSHNAHCYVPCTARLFYVTKLCMFATLVF